MRKNNAYMLVAILLLITFGTNAGSPVQGAISAMEIVSGSVVGIDGPLPGAHVRVRAEPEFTITNTYGEFVLGELTPGEVVELTAWAEGYYVASLLITPPASDVQFILRPYHTVDDDTYSWLSPNPGTSEKACGNCHPKIIPQWEANAHGGSIANPRFFSLYTEQISVVSSKLVQVT